ncbi:MAG: hypothetical protein P8Y24_04455 [Gammaproteobacteria bacterium]
MYDWINLASWKADIISADPVEFLVWSIIGAVIVFTSGFGIFRNVQRARIIEDTPTSKIRSAAQGYVEIIGRGQYFNKSPVIAPLTLTECIWYSFEILLVQKYILIPGMSGMVIVVGPTRLQ